MESNIQKRVQEWLDGPYDPATKAEICHLAKENPGELADAFYRDLSFGTGGMRAIMGTGTNRLNIYTIRMATQGLAHYILKQERQKQRVFIGYDVRINSRLFAEESACVLAGNGIEVYLTHEICPTPLASYACRAYHCSAAIMMTASHNPKQYNGFKVFWSDGAQVVLPHDEGIISEVRLIQSPAQVHLASIHHPLIHWVGDEIDQAYLSALSFGSPPTQSKLRLIYSNLHGTGLRLMPKALQQQGFSHIHLVDAQKPLDGNFPQAPSPNPEEQEALALGSEQLIKEKADLFLATDPDADRLGIVVRHNGHPIRLNGHEIASLCLEHLASSLQSQSKLPPNAAFIKTIVTSELTRKIAESFNIRCYDVLTGFKYIAEKIRQWESAASNPQFLFGAEESYGYLANTFVRDKDAISTACLICQAAEKARKQQLTLIDRLYALFQTYGVHRQSLSTLKFADSLQGMEKISSLMTKLRQNPPAVIHGKKVVRLDDYLRQSLTILPRSDVLNFWLDDESKLTIRPSGTESKIKIYIEVCEKPTDFIEESIARCEQKLVQLIDAFKTIFSEDI